MTETQAGREAFRKYLLQRAGVAFSWRHPFRWVKFRWDVFMVRRFARRLIRANRSVPK